MISNEILRFILELITVGGGATVIAYGAFTWFGKRWLEEKFAERLEAFKHQHNLQLEQYRYEINALFSRITKIHEKEFEVLPKAWSKLQDALGRVANFTSFIQYYPDLNHMTEAQVEESLAKTDLTESQKEEIQGAVDKNQAYMKTIFWYDLGEAKEYVAEFHNYLLYNKIFLSKELFESFTRVDKLLTKALDEREMMERSRNYMPASKAFAEVRDEILTTLEVIENQIQQRLHYIEA